MSAASRVVKGVVAAAVLTVGVGVTAPVAARAATGGGTTAPSGIWAGVSVYEGRWVGAKSSCTWSPAAPAGGDIPEYRDDSGITYYAYFRRCPSGITFVWIPDLPPRHLSYQATAYLEDVLPHPVPRFAPPAAD